MRNEGLQTTINVLLPFTNNTQIVLSKRNVRNEQKMSLQIPGAQGHNLICLVQNPKIFT